MHTKSILLIILSISYLSLHSQNLENDKSVVMLKANILMEKNQYDDAIQLYNQILNEDDDFAAAYLMRAKAKYELAAYLGTKKDMLKYINLSGISKEGIKLMARTEIKLDNYTAALNYSLTAIEIDPYDAEQYRIAGTLHLENKFYSEACDLFTRAVRLGDSEAENLYNNNCGLDGPVTASKRYFENDQTKETLKENTPQELDTLRIEDTLTASIIDNENKTIDKSGDNKEEAEDLIKEANDITELLGTAAYNDDLETKQEIEIDPELSVVITHGLGERKLDNYPDIFMLSSEDGKVVVDVCINNTGIVISADINNDASTLFKPGLTSLAIRKAKDFVFFPSDREEQCGWIEYYVKPSKQRR